MISIIVIESEQSELIFLRSRGMLPVIPSLFVRWCWSSGRDGRTVRGSFFLGKKVGLETILGSLNRCGRGSGSWRPYPSLNSEGEGGLLDTYVMRLSQR